MAEATEFVRVVETRTGNQIAALEEISYRNGWIDEAALRAAAERYGNSSYGIHLRTVADSKIMY